MKLRELISTLAETLKKHPEFIDLPVYVVDCRSGVMDTDVSIFDSVITSCDLNTTDLQLTDIGTPYVCISVG
jgi:hypothetical protein